MTIWIHFSLKDMRVLSMIYMYICSYPSMIPSIPVRPITFMPAHMWTFIRSLVLGLGQSASASFLQQKTITRFYLHTTFISVYDTLERIFGVLKSPFLSLYFVLFLYELAIGAPSAMFLQWRMVLMEIGYPFDTKRRCKW